MGDIHFSWDDGKPDHSSESNDSLSKKKALEIVQWDRVICVRTGLNGLVEGQEYVIKGVVYELRGGNMVESSEFRGDTNNVSQVLFRLRNDKPDHLYGYTRFKLVETWNKSVLKYFSPLSGKITTILPFSIFLAISKAAYIAAPELEPTNIPSFLTISLVIL